MIDLGPTLRDLAGLPAVSTTMGDSLAPILRREVASLPIPPAISELYDVDRELRSMRTKTAKLVHSSDVDRMDWFDLAADPDEMRSRPVRKGATSQHLVDLYAKAQEWLREGLKNRPAGPAAANPPAEISRSLNAHGYTGDDDDVDGDKE